MAYLDMFAAWLSAHPAIAVTLWPMLTAVFTSLFHWAETSAVPVLGKLVSVAKALGVDGPQVVAWLARLVKQPPPPPPPGVLLLVLGAGLALSGVRCTKSQAGTLARTGLVVAADVCRELDGEPTRPEHVALACATVEGVESVVHLPKPAWAAVKSAPAPVDAGGP